MEDINKATFGFVSNFDFAFEGLTVSLYEETKMPTNMLDLEEFSIHDNGGIRLYIRSNDPQKTINIDDSISTGFGKVIKNNASEVIYETSPIDLLKMWQNSFMVYNNNWGVFNKNLDWRNTMDRFNLTIRYDVNDYSEYTSAQMQAIWESTLRGSYATGYDSWIKYDSTILSDKIFEAASNYANNVIANDDNVLGLKTLC